MKLIRKSFRVTSIEVTTDSSDLYVKLLNKGYSFSSFMFHTLPYKVLLTLPMVGHIQPTVI